MTLKTAGVGLFAIPDRTDPSFVTSGAANTYGSWVELLASTSAAVYLTHIVMLGQYTSYTQIQIGVGGAGSESVVSEMMLYPNTATTDGGTAVVPLTVLIPVATGQRIAVRSADKDGGNIALIGLIAVAQSNVVSIDGLASGNIPTNFSLLSIDSSGRVDLAKWKGTAPNSLISGRVDANAQAVADKTGYALTSAYDPAKTAAQAGDAMALTVSERTSTAAIIWNRATSVLTASGSIGKLIVDYLNAAITSRAIPGDIMKVSSGVGANQIALASGQVTVGTNNDKTGYALAADPDVNVVKWNGNAVPTPNSDGVPIVDTREVLHVGTAQDGGSGFIQLDVGASDNASNYNGCRITIVDGTAVGQSRIITGYRGSATQPPYTAYITPEWDSPHPFFLNTPDNTSVFIITPAQVDVESWVNGVPAYLSTDGVMPSDVQFVEGLDPTNQIRDAILSDATRFDGARIDEAISSRMDALSYVAPDNGGIASIKAKTDQFVFTITNKVDSSIQAAGDFVQGAADKVWATTTRLLTAGTNIVLAKGVGVTGFNDLSTADVDAAFSANADVATILTDVGQLLLDVAAVPTAAENRDAVFAQVIADAISFLELSRLQLAEAGGKVNGSTSGTHTEHIRDVGDTKDVVTAVVDIHGNRTSVTLDLS